MNLTAETVKNARWFNLFLHQLFHKIPVDILDIHESLFFDPSGRDQFSSLSGGFPSPGKVHRIIAL